MCLGILSKSRHPSQKERTTVKTKRNQTKPNQTHHLCKWSVSWQFPIIWRESDSMWLWLGTALPKRALCPRLFCVFLFSPPWWKPPNLLGFCAAGTVAGGPTVKQENWAWLWESTRRLLDCSKSLRDAGILAGDQVNKTKWIKEDLTGLKESSSMSLKEQPEFVCTSLIT